MKYLLILVLPFLFVGCTSPSGTSSPTGSTVQTLTDAQLATEFNALPGASYYVNNPVDEHGNYIPIAERANYPKTHRVYAGQVVTFEEYKALRLNGH